MTLRIKKYINAQLAHRHFRNSDEVYIYIILQAATAFAALIHVIYLFLLHSVGITELAICNVFSIFFYGICYFILIQKKQKAYTFIGAAIALEVCLYTLITCFYIGSGSYVIFFLFLVLVMQMTITYSKPWIRILIAMIIWLSSIGAVLIGEMGIPLTRISTELHNVLMIYHLHVAFIGIVLELSVDNYVRKHIAYHTEKGVQALQNQVNTDPLTGLFNRRYAETIFPQLKSKGEYPGYCIAMLDIDNFKNVNDTYGHSIGDKVLQTLADTICNVLRKSDLVFRWGGEEFLILLEGASVENAYTTLEKLRRIIAETKIPIQDDADLKITVTIGMAFLDLNQIEACIDLCDRKMYEGKRQGKNQTVK